MADTIIGAHDGTFKTEGSISMRETQEFLALREGLSAASFESPGLAGSISLQKLYDASNAGEIVLAGNAAYPSSNYSLGGLRGSSYQNNTPPVIDLLGPAGFWVNNEVPNFGVPESYALNMQVCDPDVDFETEDWKYDNEHYVATYIHMSSLVDYSGGWPVSIAIAWVIRSFFNADDSSASTPSYSSSGWNNAQGSSILNVMDTNFKNNLFNNVYNVGYIARKVHLFQLWDNGANYYQQAMYGLYTDIYNDNRPNFSGTYEARSYTDTSNGGYIFGKFCKGPSSWNVSNYYDPFQPSATAYKESKGNGVLGATDEHVDVFNNITAVNGIGYYLHPIRKIT